MMAKVTKRNLHLKLTKVLEHPPLKGLENFVLLLPPQEPKLLKSFVMDLLFMKTA